MCFFLTQSLKHRPAAVNTKAANVLIITELLLEIYKMGWVSLCSILDAEREDDYLDLC